MKTNDFAYHLSRYFTTYLAGQRNLSDNTIIAYRDTFSKFLRFFEEQGIAPEKLSFKHITREKVEDFLTWLEVSQGCAISTRNHRLAGIKSFCKYVQIVCPDHLLLCGQIINDIHSKKGPKPIVQYLNKGEITLLLALPDLSSSSGRRDLTILALLYDAGARVQELCDLTPKNLRLNAPPTATLTGKGKKSRFVPLSAQSVQILRKYMKERKLDLPENMQNPLFTNRQGSKLTRGGVSWILAKYVKQANSVTQNALPPSLTPHCLRHSKAMHLLEAGNNLIYIRDFLGHDEVETTQIYAKANPEVKRAALEKVYQAPDAPHLPDWNDDPTLLSFLKGLSR